MSSFINFEQLIAEFIANEAAVQVSEHSSETATACYSDHAQKRADQRGISTDMVQYALKYGRKHYQKGALYYSIGRKEIHKYGKTYPAIKNMNGIHIVMSVESNTIITLFRDVNFRIIQHC